jgi:hypothetical protein
MSTMDESAIEEAVRAKRLDAPRVTPGDIDAKIVNEQFYVFPGTTVTVAALTLVNGFVVTGSSAAASPENFDEGIGRDIARAEARDKIWELEGYLLRQQLSQTENKRPLWPTYSSASRTSRTWRPPPRRPMRSERLAALPTSTSPPTRRST